jgi:magnesium transporter
LRDLLISPPDTPLPSIAKPLPAVAQVDDEAEEAAALVARYDLLALPVLDEGKLVGIITVDDALDALLPTDWREHVPRER